MIKNLKEIIIFLFAVIVLGAAVWCFLLRQSNLQDRLLHEDTLFRETVLQKKAQEQLSRLQEEIDGLQKSVNNLVSKSALLETELFSARQELEGSKRELSRLKSQNTSARQSIERASQNIDSLKNKIVHLVKESLNADERLMLLIKTKDALSQQLVQYEERFPRQVPVMPRTRHAHDETAVPETETILHEPLFASGEVLTVNREFAFLVINLGKTHGIEEGMLMDIKRDNKNIGQVRVETVREHISAAALVDRESLSYIRAGDKALVMGGI